jgi:aldose 1-epimerase
MPVPPSGDQFEIVHGDQRATIVEVGGGVREYVVGDRDVLHPYPLDAVCDGAHGAPLIPWPNRLADGRYSFDGEEHQLALTEPEKQNAIHGLLRWRSWRARERSTGRVVVGTLLHPLTGWPFTLAATIAYTLDDTGLSVETRVTNLGEGPAPLGVGQHPYLSPGPDTLVDDCTLELCARTRILTDPERQLPRGREDVEATEFDFRSPRAIDGLQIDDAFTGLDRDRDGLAWVRLGRPDGRTVALWCDESYPMLQIYTAHTLAPARRRRGLAAEPMTCPPNGLQTGEGVARLDPGETRAYRWGVGMA